MVEDQLKKRDLEVFLETNKRAIELEAEVASQNEEIISLLSTNKNKQDEVNSKLEKLIEKIDGINRDLFKIQVLFIGGLLSFLAQIVVAIIKK